MPRHHTLHCRGSWISHLDVIVAQTLLCVFEIDQLRRGRNLSRVVAVRSKVGVVPIRMREIECNFQSPRLCRLANLTDNVPPERSLFNAVGEIAVFEFWSARRPPIDAGLHTRL